MVTDFTELGERAAISLLRRVATGVVQPETVEISGPNYDLAARGDVTRYHIPLDGLTVVAQYSAGPGFKTYWVQLIQDDEVLGATYSNAQGSDAGKAVEAVRTMMEPVTAERRRQAGLKLL